MNTLKQRDRYPAFFRGCLHLGRYTHRIAISNHRLVSVQDRQVTFRYKDRAEDNKEKLLTLDAVDFLSRFLTHVLPKGFMRIRHFGFLANVVRKDALARCRKHLRTETEPGDSVAPEDKQDETWQQLLERLTGIDVTLCPVCNTGHFVQKEPIPKAPPKWFHLGRAASS